MLVTLRALCRTEIRHNAREATHDDFFNLVFLELYDGQIRHNARGLLMMIFLT
jgi:hypothetical protein